MTEDAEFVADDLSAEERNFLAAAMNEWQGPASPNNEIAIAIGFASRADLIGNIDRLWTALRGETRLSRLDWVRVLLAAEIVFASNTLGSGHDWEATVGMSDKDSITMLRSIQQKLVRHTADFARRRFGTRS